MSVKVYEMGQVFSIIFMQIVAGDVSTQTEVGPEGHKLILLVIIALFLGLILAWFIKPPKHTWHIKNIFRRRERKVVVDLKKNRNYHPDKLFFTLQNNSKKDVDINAPLLVFSGLWYSRKFKLKGVGSIQVYPLFLEKSESHELEIDLNRFYNFDKRLKRLPRVKIVVSDVNGKKVGSKKILLRKTLFNI